MSDWEDGYRQGRLDAAADIRALAQSWPWHMYDYLPKIALAKAALMAEGTPDAVPAP